LTVLWMFYEVNKGNVTDKINLRGEQVLFVSFKRKCEKGCPFKSTY
jgi:hypothetical protein